MDLGLQTRSRDKFISIINGKFTLRVPTGTPGSVTRVNKNNVEVSEMLFDSFAGYLTGISTRSHEQYGKQWSFELSTGKETYVFTAPYSDAYSKTLLKVLPNLDLTQPIKLSPSVKEEDGKTKKSLFIEQDGKVISHFFKKGENGLPDMELIKVKGNDTWDDTKQMAFLEDYVETTVKPKLKTSTLAVEAPVQSEGHQWEEELSADVAVEDLPF